MTRLFVGSVVIGIAAGLIVYFVAPAISSATDVVAYVAGMALELSNTYFEDMPPIVADYISGLNLAVAAATVGVMLIAFILFGGLFVITVARVAKHIASWFRRDDEAEIKPDLPSIDMDPKYLRSMTGKEILGRGIDSIDRD